MSVPLSLAALMLVPAAPPVEAPTVLAEVAPVAAPETPAAGEPVAEPAPAPEGDQIEPDDVVVKARKHVPGDPLVALNAKAFDLTQKFDEAVVSPVALGFASVVPEPILDGVGNALKNLREPGIFLNFLLQHKVGKAAETAGRFLINSTIGIAGLFDVARHKPFHLPRRPNGFSDTFGFYGVKPGPFFFLPVAGPTTLRDLVGGGLDRLVLPLAVGKPFNKLWFTAPTGLIVTLDRRTHFDDALRKIREQSDPYSARRDFYLAQRQAEIDHLRGKKPPAEIPKP